MKIEEFKEEVRSFADLYLVDYPRSFEITFDVVDPGMDIETYTADILVVMADGSTWNIPIIQDEDGDPVIESGDDYSLPMDAESVYAVLWFEAMDRQKQAEACVAKLEVERNDAIHREHEASEQIRACHEILDRLGAPRNQDSGLSYHLNGRLSRLVANETGQLWEARMGEMEALLRRARAVIPSEYEDEIEVRAAINRHFNEQA